MINSEIIFLVQDSPEGGYEARALSHSIFTEADTLDELKLMIKDAIACHFDENERPRILSDIATHLQISKETLLEKLS